MLKKIASIYALHDIVVFAYGIGTAALICIFHSAVTEWKTILLLHTLVLVIVAIIPVVYKNFNRKFWRTVRYWYPLVLLMFAYRELHYLVHPISPNDLDDLLIKIDYIFFGEHPTVLLESITTPLLTEFLQIIYSLFYLLPVSLGAFLYVKKEWDKLENALAFILLGFFSSYIGFYIIPAIGPRFTLIAEQSMPYLQGALTYDWLRGTLNALELEMRDCFPSGHTEVALMVLIVSYKINKTLFRIYLPIVLLLMFSTVYLRYHYVIDVIAGALAAFLLLPLNTFLHNKWKKYRINP